MLAGVRNIALGAAIAMAGVLAVTAAEGAWGVLFLPMPSPNNCLFDCDYTIGTSSFTESLIGVAVMIWLVTRMVGRGLKSIAAGR
jgi:hypothetical protein